ncbi:MAG TPA: DUF4233 domain-containing protein [Actinopolymorphaceae bacterium]|jgi:nicotinamide riboside transporter PnuC
MRSVLSAVLICEAIVIGLAVPVAITLGNVDTDLAVAVGAGVGAACVVTAGLQRYRFGLVLGSALQVVTFGLGFVVSLLFVLGLIFGGIWFACVAADRRIAALKAEREKAERERVERDDEEPAGDVPRGDNPADPD